MFFTLSYTTHVIISILLHVGGVTCGLFIWYVFPKNPYKIITKVPEEKQRLIVEEHDEVEEDNYTLKSKSKLIRTSG